MVGVAKEYEERG